MVLIRPWSSNRILYRPVNGREKSSSVFGQTVVFVVFDTIVIVTLVTLIIVTSVDWCCLAIWKCYICKLFLELLIMWEAFVPIYIAHNRCKAISSWEQDYTRIFLCDINNDFKRSMFCKIYFSRYFAMFDNDNIVAMIFNMVSRLAPR